MTAQQNPPEKRKEYEELVSNYVAVENNLVSSLEELKNLTQNTQTKQSIEQAIEAVTEDKKSFLDTVNDIYKKRHQLVGGIHSKSEAEKALHNTIINITLIAEKTADEIKEIGKLYDLMHTQSLPPTFPSPQEIENETKNFMTYDLIPTHTGNIITAKSVLLDFLGKNNRGLGSSTSPITELSYHIPSMVEIVEHEAPTHGNDYEQLKKQYLNARNEALQEIRNKLGEEFSKEIEDFIKQSDQNLEKIDKFHNSPASLIGASPELIKKTEEAVKEMHKSMIRTGITTSEISNDTENKYAKVQIPYFLEMQTQYEKKYLGEMFKNSFSTRIAGNEKSSETYRH